MNPVRSESRRSASVWSGNGRTAAPSSGGGGSSAGAALVLATVQNRSATPATNAVTRRIASALSGTQSIHRGATMSSAARSPSAPTMVQRRSSGPPGVVSEVSGPSRTAPNNSVDRIRAPNTAATAKATPRYPPPKDSSGMAVCTASTTRTSNPITSPTPPTSCADHSRFN